MKRPPPPVAIGLDYARYLRGRLEVAGEALIAAALQGWDPDRGRVPRAPRVDASSVDKAVRALVTVLEAHPPDPAKVEAVGAKVSKANERTHTLIGVPTRGMGRRSGVQSPIRTAIFQAMRTEKEELEKLRSEHGPKITAVNGNISITTVARDMPQFTRAQVKAEFDALSREGFLSKGPKGSGYGSANTREIVRLPIDGPASTMPLDQFRQENLSLIRTLDQDTVDRFRSILEEADRSAMRVEDLRGRLVEELGVSKRHADLLARDQVLKFNAQLTESRQTAAGVTHYEWSTSGDERVRPAHAELDGTIQSWADPPVVDEKDDRRAHPGEDYQCRCVAIPILD